MNQKEKIISAAKELISKFGFKKTTMEDIAEKVRMAKATLYHYFKSKEDILREIIKREGEIIRKKIINAVKNSKNPEEKIKNYALTRFRYLRELAIYYASLREDYYIHFNFIEKERKEFDEFELSMLENILKEGIKEGCFNIPNPRLYVFLLLQSMKGIEYPIATGVALKLDNKKIKLEDAIEILLNILLEGIKRKK